MTPEEIEKAVAEMNNRVEAASYKESKKKFNLYVNGGYDGLQNMYYNYMREQKIKFPAIENFTSYIKGNDPQELFLDKIFFEVDNNYQTNIGVYVYRLCKFVISDLQKDQDNKKVEIFEIAKRLEQEIAKSAASKVEANPKLYIILKKIESYYRTIYINVTEDFSPYLVGRITPNYLLNPTSNPINLKETLAFNIALLFYTGEVKILKGLGDKFEYAGTKYSSGNSLAKALAPILTKNANSIKSYLNETYNNSHNDKNVFHSPKIREEVTNYCLIHDKKIHLPD